MCGRGAEPLSLSLFVGTAFAYSAHSLSAIIIIHPPRPLNNKGRRARRILATLNSHARCNQQQWRRVFHHNFASAAFFTAAPAAAQEH